uniref:Uncharacterized protein n=1 Tax=Arundo donax TaxID=35708 RepID=A0A0A9EW02_ARUDO
MCTTTNRILIYSKFWAEETCEEVVTRSIRCWSRNNNSSAGTFFYFIDVRNDIGNLFS